METIKKVLSPQKAHDTTLSTEIAPEVVHETVLPSERLEVRKDILQEHELHHHQQRVQPVTDQRILETQHKAQTLETEHHHLKNEMAHDDKTRLEGFHTQHRDEQNVADTERTRVDLDPTVREKFHHHIHETIQPVIQRETVAPTVVHTKGVVHEHIHDQPIVHDPTIEPAKTLEEFKSHVQSFGSTGKSTETIQDYKPNVVPTAKQH